MIFSYNLLSNVNFYCVGIKALVDLITSGRKEIQGLAAITIANIAKSSRARNLLRRCGGIRKLVRAKYIESNLLPRLYPLPREREERRERRT